MRTIIVRSRPQILSLAAPFYPLARSPPSRPRLLSSVPRIPCTCTGPSTGRSMVRRQVRLLFVFVLAVRGVELAVALRLFQ